MLKIFNTLTRKVEDFKPLNPSDVGMYTCGPTVYNFQHIGNFRTMIFSDLLYRTLVANGYKVRAIRNITDIDDKIIKGAKEKNLLIEEFSTGYTKAFFNDLNKLNVSPVDVNPKATEHIGQMIKYIEVLIEKRLAYQEEDGSVYFDISEFPEYGKLSQIEKRELRTGTRILSDEYSKDDVQDFALWKSVGANEPIGYDSPWGRGRPGWHIECSVMSQEYLGDTLDIHAGGIDLLFPHHENEIAQSEGKTGKPFTNYFIHGEHVLVDGTKMSKSLKNFYVLSDLEAKGFDPLSYRYLVLSSHYRDKLNFTWESLQAAQNTLNNIRGQIRGWDNPTKNETGEFYERFLEALNNDLNTPQALAILHEMLKANMPSSEKAADLLAMDKVLGLKLNEYLGQKVEASEDVQKLLEKRELARASKNFEESDRIRKEIKDLGFEVEDTDKGPRLKKLS